MEEAAFTGGIRPGGLTKSYEVNILICYVLAKAGEPMTFAQLADTTQRDQLVNYFEFAQAMSLLEKGGQLEVREENGRQVYLLTESGLQAANTFGKDLPRSVRERAVRVAQGILTRQRREKEILSDIQRVEDGYRLTLRLTDIGSDLLDIGIFLPNEETCRQVRQRFLDDPMEIYKGILSLLTGEEQQDDGR